MPMTWQLVLLFAALCNIDLMVRNYLGHRPPLWTGNNNSAVCHFANWG